jgi:hypothetical protein
VRAEMEQHGMGVSEASADARVPEKDLREVRGRDHG